MRNSNRLLMLNIMLFALQVVFIIFYDIYETLYFKILTSLCFVVAGFINIDRKSSLDKKFPYILFTSFIFDLCGDIAIFFNFVAGTSFFFVGHILKIAAYTILQKFNKKDIICSVLAFLPSIGLIFFAPGLQYDNKVLPVICLLYSMILGIMCGKAVGNYLNDRSRFKLITMLGAFMFLISDSAVAYMTFAVNPGPYLILNSILYFPGVFVLSQSIRKYYEN